MTKKRAVNITKKELKYILKNRTDKQVLSESERSINYLILGKDYILEDLKILRTDKDYDIKSIIMANDVNNKSFVFPNLLLTCEGKLVGYTSYYFHNKINSSYLGSVHKLETEPFLFALRNFIRDIKSLSDNNILIKNLNNNLLYDCYNLVAIDTLDYEISDKDNIFEKNIQALKEAFKAQFIDFLDVIWTHHFNIDEEIDLIVREIDNVKKKELV